ncbi:TraB/GumN family protein [Flaviaesturariibacter terrae]
MKTRLRLLLFAFLLGSSAAAVAQSPQPAALLWRISGKGLAAPSYLWGTIHLQDRRVFRFTDSFFYYFDRSAAFAMELDPEKTTQELLPFLTGRDTSALLYTVLPDSLFSRLGPLLEDALHKPARSITRKEAWLYAQLRPYRVTHPGDMPLPMDLYLHGLAKKRKKLLLGIEDMSDQFSPDEVLNGPFDTRALLQTEADVRKQTEAIVQLYIHQDLEGIERLALSDSVQEARKLLARNRKMAGRIDSLAALRPTFFAIGAGHLPGPGGVLALLRRRGYTVRAVSAGRLLDPSDLPPEGWQGIDGPRKK